MKNVALGQEIERVIAEGTSDNRVADLEFEIDELRDEVLNLKLALRSVAEGVVIAASKADNLVNLFTT